MKDKLYYNFVNALIAVGILSIPLSILLYILYDTKLIRSYFNHFNILVGGALLCLLSFVCYFILTRTSNYKRIAWKYKQANETEFELTLANDIKESLSIKMNELGYRENSMPGFSSVYINEQLMPSKKVFAKVVHLSNNGYNKEYVKQFDDILRKYYSDNDIDIEAITGVVCFIEDESKAKKYSNIKDYFYYDAAKNIVSQFVMCAADSNNRALYFNNDNITGKRSYPLKMITDIFGKERNS